MKLIHLIISSILLCLIPSMIVFGAWGCVIESWPSPAMAEYKKNVSKVLEKLSQLTSRTRCASWVEWQGKRALSRIDSSFNEGFTMADILVDFRYNFALIGRGEMRQSVLREGSMIKQLEGNIISRLTAMGSNCALDIVVDSAQLHDGLSITRKLSGWTVEAVFDSLIQNNKNIESFYKRVSVGDNPGPSQFSLVPDTFSDEVSALYQPWAVASCNPKNGELSWEKVVDKGMKAIEFKGKSTEKWLTSWKSALALLENNSKEIQDRDLARRLLKQELQNQGIGGTAVSITFFSVAAFDANTGNNSKDSEADKNLNQRTKNTSSDLGNRVDQFFGSLLPKSKTTDQWIQRINNIQTQKVQAIPIFEEYQVAKSLLWNEAETDTKIITDLVDLHIKLSQINENLKPAIKKAIKICEKQIVWVGNCSNY